MNGQPAWREVKISAHIIHWPKQCACCGGPSDTSVQVSHERSKGIRVVRTQEKSWEVPYCRRCLEHIAAKTQLEHTQREAEIAAIDAEGRRRHAAKMDTSAWYVIAIGVVVGLMVGSGGLCCGLMSAPAAGSGQPVARIFLILLTIVLDLCVIAGLAYLVYIIHQKAMIADRRKKKQAIENAAQRVEDARLVGQKAQAETARYQRLFASECSCTDIAAHYLGWHGTVHTFQFSNPAFVAAFANANKGKLLT